jgi:hypothetical protein
VSGQIITAAVAVIALLIALPALRRATRALHLAAGHEEALRLAARETPLEAIADATRELPPWNDEQIERLREAIEKDSEQ